MTLRRVSAFETEPNLGANRVIAPNEYQYDRMQDRRQHGEEAFTENYPDIDYSADITDVMLNTLSSEVVANDLPYNVFNMLNEVLAGPGRSVHDFVHIRSLEELWHDRDEKYLDQIQISGGGCWEMPKYEDLIMPNRARYPQPRVYSREHGDIRQLMGSQWMWERVIGPLPDDKLPNGRRAFWLDHRCNNKACVYPRHLVMGLPEANDAFTARMNMIEQYEAWMGKRWARPSFAYPEGLEHVVHESEVRVLSERAVLLPAHMSLKELVACRRVLGTATHLPDGGYTTDPGYHVLIGALKRGVEFDEKTGCWNAQIDLDLLPPHKRTIVHACGNGQCCNIRHMDIAEDHIQFYEIVGNNYVTLPDGRIVNTRTGEYLPPYWESWNLYWNWLKKYSESPSLGQEQELADEDDPQSLLSEVDFSHIWVHPLTGCWENERFYPRWTSNGAQQNAYGFHRSSYGELGRSTHRFLLHKYREYIGEPENLSLENDADHRCDNRRCCNPLHMQLTKKDTHNMITRQRRAESASEIARIVDLRQKLRRNGRLRR